MNYKIFLVCVCLVYAQTDLTLLNCPSQFNITAANVTISSSLSLNSFLYGSFSQARIRNIIATGNTDDLSSEVTSMMIPYIIFLVFWIILFLLTTIFCLFDKSCPPYQSCRRDLVVKPYTKKEIRVTACIALCIAVSVLIISVVSFSLFPAMKTNLALTKCSLYVGIDTALNGDGVWGGFINLQYQIGNITSLLASAITKISTYFPGDDWLMDNMLLMKNANLAIYSANKNSQLISPNPATTATASNAGQATPLIDSVFIKTGMGPNGTFNTMVDDIDKGLRTTQKLSQQAYSIQLSTQILVNSASSIQQNSVNSQNTLLMYINQLQSVSTFIESFSNSYFQRDFSLGVAVFQGIVGFALAASLLILLGIASTHIFDILKCRKMVHLGWAIFGLSYMGIIVCTFVLLSVGSLGYGFCSYFSNMLKDVSQFDTLNEAYSQNVFGRLDVCIFGDGNALQKFGLAAQMRTVTSLFTNIATFYDYLNVKSNNFVDVSISTTTITGWIAAMQKYQAGIYIDSISTQTTSDNPNYAINQLNLYTNTGGGVATGTRDVWVWDAANCTNPTQVTFVPDATLTHGKSISTSTVTCMSFNTKISTSMSNIWTQSDFISRYVQIKNNYPDAYTQIIYYGMTLIAFRDSRINLFQSISASLGDLLSSNQNFNSLITGFQGRVTQFYGAVSTLNNLITNPLNGLIVSSNCHSFADKLRFTYNVFCVNFMSQIGKMALCCLLLLGFMMAGVFAGCVFGVRYAEIEKNQRANMSEYSQNSQKEKHEETGNSSDDDE